MTRNVAQVPKHTSCRERAAARGDGQRIGGLREPACDPGAFASGGPIAVCVERGDDAAHEAGRLGGAAAASGVDSGEYTALRGHVGAGLDEDALFFAEALPKVSREMFCDECFVALAGTDSARVQVQEIEQESFGGAADYRTYRGAVEGGGFHSATVAASDGRARDESGESAAG